MTMFTVQSTVGHLLVGVYNDLDAILADLPSVVLYPDTYLILECVVNMGILRRWQATEVDGKVYWEVIEEDY